ncbi:UNVERIFIED_CONTAM: hypothetical protein FKN15_067367 [Acipenser sinensis]
MGILRSDPMTKPASSFIPRNSRADVGCYESDSYFCVSVRAPREDTYIGVGFKVGSDAGITHFVLQIHYGDIAAFRDNHKDCSGVSLRMTSKPQPLIAGMYLLMSVDTVIPPGKKVVNADIACMYRKYPIYPFAFRTHTHRLGKVVSGYRVRDGKWTLIGRQSPQLPQASQVLSFEIRCDIVVLQETLLKVYSTKTPTANG